MQSVLLDALPSVVGSAVSYDFEVTGSTMDAGYLKKVGIQGRRMVRRNSPVVEHIKLDLFSVTYDRQAKQLTAVRSATGQVQVWLADLASYLQQRGWVEDADVGFEPLERIIVTGTPKILGVDVPGSGGTEFQEHLLPQSAQLQLTVGYLRISSVQALGLARTLLQATVRPILDLSATPCPHRSIR